MRDNNGKLVYSGTSGLVLPAGNKRSFPPAFQDKSRLSYYASLFNSIEINSSFKKPPMARTVEKWAASVPQNFKFTFKLWKQITHNKGLTFSSEDVKHFMQVIAHAGDKKGALLVQFPGKLDSAHLSDLTTLLTTLRQQDPAQEWNIAVEFRNKSWYNTDTYQLLQAHHMSMVLHDLPASAPPIQDTASDFIYLRFHGPEKGYRGSYPDDFLYTYAARINGWNDEGKLVYVYFNNTLGDAANNVTTLNRFIRQ